MKHLLLVLLCLLGTLAQARHPNTQSVKTRIADDDTTLTICIDQSINGQFAHYQHSFNVTGMNRLEKEWLKYQTFTAQNVALPLQEMSGLIVTALSLMGGVLTLLIMRYHTRKGTA